MQVHFSGGGAVDKTDTGRALVRYTVIPILTVALIPIRVIRIIRG